MNYYSNEVKFLNDENQLNNQNKSQQIQLELANVSKKKNYPDKNIITINKGDFLEFRIKRLLFAMGYFCKIGVLIKTSQDDVAEYVTDLDVLGISIQRDFTSKTIWADCKAGKAKPLERISWINGIKNFVGIDDAIFVKKNVRVTTKQFARKSNIQVLDLEIINKLEKDYGIEAECLKGSWNYGTQIKSEQVLLKMNIDNNESIKKIVQFTKSGYWSLNEYTRIKKCITALKQLGEMLRLPLKQEEFTAIRWVIYEVINLFVLATLKVCRNTYYFSEKDRNQVIYEGLISGEISNKKRKELVEASYKMAYSIIKSQIPGFNGKIELPNFNMTAPVYCEAYLDLISRIVANPLDYYDILRYLDFMMMEYDLNSKDIDIDEMKIYFDNYIKLNKSAKTLLHFICTITNLPLNIFNILK